MAQPSFFTSGRFSSLSRSEKQVTTYNASLPLSRIAAAASGMPGNDFPVLNAGEPEPLRQIIPVHTGENDPASHGDIQLVKVDVPQPACLAGEILPDTASTMMSTVNLVGGAI